MEDYTIAVNKVVTLTFCFLIVFLYFSRVAPLRRVKVDLLCRAWAMLSAVHIALSVCTILLHYTPQFAFQMPSMIPADELEHTLYAALRSSALNALPNLVFWHNGLPYLEIPECVPAEELVGLPPKAELDKKRATWQAICLSFVINDLMIALVYFIALQQ